MPSPFPGMDPYLESAIWPNFHNPYANALRTEVNKLLPNELVATVEVNLVSDHLLIPRANYRPDVSIETSADSNDLGSQLNDAGSQLSVVTPPSIQLFHKLDVETKLLTILVQKVEGSEIIAAIEILSPVNKRKPYLQQYRKKRKAYFDAGIHLLEIDLLIAGTRPVYQADWPAATYVIQLEEAIEQKLSVWAFGLEDSIPTIQLPLLPEMEGINLNLQRLFAENYEAGSYQKLLRYGHPLSVKLERAEDQELLNHLNLQ